MPLALGSAPSPLPIAALRALWSGGWPLSAVRDRRLLSLTKPQGRATLTISAGESSAPSITVRAARPPGAPCSAPKKTFKTTCLNPSLRMAPLCPPQTSPFIVEANDFDGLGGVFGYAGNKYGWMVEVDPANADDYGVKHTWLGRFRHEAVAVRAVANQKLAVYSGCDRRGGHLYKFVSSWHRGQSHQQSQFPTHDRRHALRGQVQR
jgi:hypothetical protein